MPVVTALLPQRRRAERVSVHLDGAYAFGLVRELAAGLRVGQVLGADEVAALRAGDEGARAYDRALRFLAPRPRGRAEVTRYLTRHAVAEATIARVEARLAELGLIDDDAFARWWVENRTAFRPRSARALRHELTAKGVPPAVIDAALAGVDDAALAHDLATARAARLRGVDRPTFERRLSGFLARRGFAGPTVRAAVAAAWASTAGGTDRPAAG